ncbi:MAG: CarD family transcriptional regulator [Blastocatellia bacterium]
MIWTVGNKVVYPSQGPCRIGRIVKRDVGGTLIKFYHLVVLDGSGGDLYVPVDKAQEIGLRLLLERSEIPKLFGQSKRTAYIAGNGRQQAIDNSKLFSSGSPFDLAEIVESLTQLKETKTLTIGQSRTLEKARRLLICEISEVLEATKAEAEQQLDQALKARTAGRKRIS